MRKGSPPLSGRTSPREPEELGDVLGELYNLHERVERAGLNHVEDRVVVDGGVCVNDSG